MNQMKVGGALLVLLLGAVGCGESQSSEIDRLNRKVAELDRENQRLWEQADLHKKEPWRSLANWNRIRLGMTRNQVLDVMGFPREKTYIGESSPRWESWRYGTNGRILFRPRWVSPGVSAFGEPLPKEKTEVLVGEIKLPKELR